MKAEFEECWNQLESRPPVSIERREECKATMASLAHKYANAPLDKTGFPLDRDHMKTLNELRKNQDIIISRPDKGNGVVILDRSDYIAKMMTILSDREKFECIGDVDTCDNTLQQERALQAFLLRHHKAGHISQQDYARIRPVGASRPRMYGLPKIHKPGGPLRPILSMVNAPQHELAKWLATLLDPVLQKYGEHAVKDTFEFCESLETCAAEKNVTGSFMCSFDVESLFTNIPLEETLQICLDTLYRDSEISEPAMPEGLLRKLLVKATTEVEFSFDGVMYRQIDGVAMGSPLGPVLANIFMGFCEAKVPTERWPLFYRRFVDDTFAVFESESGSLDFFRLLNGLHPALKFTIEGEKDDRLPFMDVLVKRVDGAFIRSVYRKPTFNGLYTRWDSFTATGHKINLIKSLTSRAKRICSPQTLDAEIATLKGLFADNGYPAGVVDRIVKRTLGRVVTINGDEDVKFVSLRLPWIGPVSTGFRVEIELAVTKAYLKTGVRVCFTSTRAFSGKAKDVLPPTSKSNVVYEYGCCCGQTYVGKTSQRLSERIRQHVPDSLMQTRPVTRKAKVDSAVTRHLKENPTCIDSNQKSMTGRFRILAQARSQLQLDVLEALLIKKLSPNLCQQKSFVRVLRLF